MIVKLAAMMGVPKFVVWIGIIILSIGLFFGAKALYDKSVIDEHDTKVELEAAKEDRKADEVIAERAPDADDRLFAPSNRGSHVAVAAPGVDIFLPAPNGKYQMTSGTSWRMRSTAT